MEDLAHAGYHCVNVGKMHTYPSRPQRLPRALRGGEQDRYLEGRYFFDRWDVASRQGCRDPGASGTASPDYAERLGAISWGPLRGPEHLHSDVYVGAWRAGGWSRSPPRGPSSCKSASPARTCPRPRYLDQYEGVELPLPQVTAAEIEALPAPLRTMRVHNTEVDHDSILWSLDPSPAQLRRLWTHYLANVTMIDEQVGALLGALAGGGPRRRRGHLHLRPRRLPGRPRADPEVDDARLHHPRPVRGLVAQPLRRGPAGDGAVAADGPRPGPAGAGGGAGARVLEAVSMAPALRGDLEEAGREHVYCEQAGDNILAGTELMTMVRGREWKLVHYLGLAEGELYHLPADPGERTNLWSSADPEPVAQKARLQTLLEWRLRGLLRRARRRCSPEPGPRVRQGPSSAWRGAPRQSGPREAPGAVGGAAGHRLLRREPCSRRVCTSTRPSPRR